MSFLDVAADTAVVIDIDLVEFSVKENEEIYLMLLLIDFPK